MVLKARIHPVPCGLFFFPYGSFQSIPSAKIEKIRKSLPVHFIMHESGCQFQYAWITNAAFHPMHREKAAVVYKNNYLSNAGLKA